MKMPACRTPTTLTLTLWPWPTTFDLDSRDLDLQPLTLTLVTLTYDFDLDFVVLILTIVTLTLTPFDIDLRPYFLILDWKLKFLQFWPRWHRPLIYDLYLKTDGPHTQQLQLWGYLFEKVPLKWWECKWKIKHYARTWYRRFQRCRPKKTFYGMQFGSLFIK